MSNLLDKYTARALLVDIADAYQNDWLTPEGFAESNALTVEQARQVIALAQAVRNSAHPDA